MKNNDCRIKISTIMPVYNSEEWIKETIDSWLAQTISEKELICVDDCSTDNSRQIIKDYAEKNSNIRLYVMKCNGGAGSARNMGIKKSSGEYISFLDSDDCYLRNDALEIIYKYASFDKCNVVGGQLKYINDQNDRLDSTRSKIDYQDLSFGDFQEDYYFTSYIYKRCFLVENDIYFPCIRMYEDPPFLEKALNLSGTIRKIEIEYYGYKYVEKKRTYTNDMLVDLTSGFLMSLQYAETCNLQMLKEKVINRINSRYFTEILIKGIEGRDNRFFSNLSDIYDLISSDGYKLDIIDYLSFLITENNIYDSFLFRKRCNHILEEGKRVAIYGAGYNGQKLYKLIDDGYKDNRVVLWCDAYKCGQEIYGEMIYGIEEIRQKKDMIDVVVISIDNELISEEVKKDIQNIGVPEYKIRGFVNY